ncbi:MAG: DUF6513 domain-containing protein [Hyphomicrobiaceae bacterium]
MAEKFLFITGHLAESRLQDQVAGLDLEEASWRVVNIGVKVAALMTEAIVIKRLATPLDADRVIVPGRTRMDLKKLSSHFGVPFERGPDELIDIPQFFGHGRRAPDLSQYDVRIFAETIEAPTLTVEAIVHRAHEQRAAGADVIDLGCQPDTHFPHLEDVIGALKAEGYKVSVDSGDTSELERGVKAGADFVFSLDETTLDIVADTSCVAILVPKPHGDLASLLRAIDAANEKGIAHIADPILDPIHFGFMASLERYAQLRRARPDVEILMGTGNLTELTDADSLGVTAALLGVCSELEIRNVLVVQVSPHTRRTIEEHDAARRLMYRAKSDAGLPKGYGDGLLSLHNLKPFTQTPAEISEMAAAVRDLNYRIEAAEDGVHIYNRDGHAQATDAFALYPKLGVSDDASHAFYLGYELAKAEIAYDLGKRYTQDRPLDWGVSADKQTDNEMRHAKEGETLKAKRAAQAKARHERRTQQESVTPKDVKSGPKQKI